MKKRRLRPISKWAPRRFRRPARCPICGSRVTITDRLDEVMRFELYPTVKPCRLTYRCAATGCVLLDLPIWFRRARIQIVTAAYNAMVSNLTKERAEELYGRAHREAAARNA